MPKAVWNEAVIAESDDVEVVDGYSYFPADAVDRRYLQASDHRSRCAWKGTASYYDVVVDGEVNRAAAWHYPDPSPRAAPLVRGRIGFWRGVKNRSRGRPTLWFPAPLGPSRRPIERPLTAPQAVRFHHEAGRLSPVSEVIASRPRRQ